MKYLSMAETQTVTILLLGDPDCGKSTFLSRISKGAASISSKDPIALLRDGDQPFIFDVSVRKQSYRFEFYDTSSPENWQLLIPDVVVICYDISSRLSLIHVKKIWRSEVITRFARNREVPTLLLGLKRDLRSETDPNGIIYPQEAYRNAQEMRIDRYMECSAATGELVREAFEDICKTAIGTTKSGSEGNKGLSEGGCEIM